VHVYDLQVWTELDGAHNLLAAVVPDAEFGAWVLQVCSCPDEEENVRVLVGITESSSSRNSGFDFCGSRGCLADLESTSRSRDEVAMVVDEFERVYLLLATTLSCYHWACCSLHLFMAI